MGVIGTPTGSCGSTINYARKEDQEEGGWCVSRLGPGPSGVEQLYRELDRRVLLKEKKRRQRQANALFSEGNEGAKALRAAAKVTFGSIIQQTRRGARARVVNKTLPLLPNQH